MSTTALPQPISGVSSNRETVLETVFPGVATTFLGRLIGSVMGAVYGVGPLPVRLVALVIVGAIFAPLGALLYFYTKVVGSYYVVTNRTVQQRTVLSQVMTKQVNLADVDSVEVQLQDGYDFHLCGDVVLLSSRGDELLVIPAIQYPKRLAHVILESRDARMQSDASLKHMQARG